MLSDQICNDIERYKSLNSKNPTLVVGKITFSSLYNGSIPLDNFFKIFGCVATIAGFQFGYYLL
jgi:hypothetical protein